MSEELSHRLFSGEALSPADQAIEAYTAGMKWLGHTELTTQRMSTDGRDIIVSNANVPNVDLTGGLLRLGKFADTNDEDDALKPLLIVHDSTSCKNSGRIRGVSGDNFLPLGKVQNGRKIISASEDPQLVKKMYDVVIDIAEQAKEDYQKILTQQKSLEDRKELLRSISILSSAGLAVVSAGIIFMGGLGLKDIWGDPDTPPLAPWPIEWVVDLMNSHQHTAEGFENPSIATGNEPKFLEGIDEDGLQPVFVDDATYDLSGAPEGIEVGYMARPEARESEAVQYGKVDIGVWRVPLKLDPSRRGYFVSSDLGKYEGQHSYSALAWYESGCAYVKGPFSERRILPITNRLSIAEEVVIKRAGGNALVACRTDGEPIQDMGGYIHIYVEH